MQETEPAKKNSWLYPLVALPLLITLSVDILCRSFDLSSHLAMRLSEAQKMAGGATPYLDFFSLESPFALLLSTVPLALHRWLFGTLHLFVPVGTLSKELVLLLVLASLLLSLALLRPGPTLVRGFNRYFALAFVLANYFVRFEFGELQHMFILAILPLSIVRWLNYQGHKPSTVLVLAANLSGLFAILLDPFYLFYWFVCELILALWAKRFDSRCLIFDAVALAASILPVLGVKAQEAYSGWILPLRIARLGIFDDALAHPGGVPDRRDIVLLACAALLLLYPRLKKMSLLVIPAVLLLMGFAQYTLECEGLSVSLVITAFSSVLIIASLFFDLLQKRGKILLAVSTLVSIFASVSFYQNSARQIDAALAAPVELMREGLPDIAQIIDTYTKAGEQVLILSDFAPACYPLLNNYDRIQSGYMTYGKPLHLLRMVKEKNRLSPSLSQYKKYVEDKLSSDLLKGKQKLLIVHLNHELEDLQAIPEAAGAFANNYDLLYKCYFYTNRREPKEMTGLLYPFYVYLPGPKVGAP